MNTKTQRIIAVSEMKIFFWHADANPGLATIVDTVREVALFLGGRSVTWEDQNAAIEHLAHKYWLVPQAEQALKERAGQP